MGDGDRRGGGRDFETGGNGNVAGSIFDIL